MHQAVLTATQNPIEEPPLPAPTQPGQGTTVTAAKGTTQSFTRLHGAHSASLKPEGPAHAAREKTGASQTRQRSLSCVGEEPDPNPAQATVTLRSQPPCPAHVQAPTCETLCTVSSQAHGDFAF